MALLPPLLAVAWFAWRGALHDLIAVHLLYNLQVYSGAGVVRRWNSLRGRQPAETARPFVLRQKIWRAPPGRLRGLLRSVPWRAVQRLNFGSRYSFVSE